MEYSNRFEANRFQTQEHIKDTFTELYIEKGLDSIRIQELCKAAGVSKTTFYKYYDDKYQVLEEIEVKILKDLRDIYHNFLSFDIKQHDYSKPIPQLLETCNYIKKHSVLFERLLSVNSNNRFLYNWKKEIREDFKRKFTYDQMNSQRIAFQVEATVSSVIGLFTYWLFKQPNMSSNDFATLAGEIIAKDLY